MKIITEEMRFRKRLCEFALKYGVTKAAKRYHTNRQFVYRQLEKYDGTLRSLALQSRKPHSHPNAHTKEELTLIKQIYSRYGCDGLAEVYVQLRKRGYNVDIGMIETRANNEYKQLEVDFVANKGDNKYYIQSTLNMSDENVAEREQRPLLKINDSFKKIIIVKDDIMRNRNEEGIITMGIYDFLTDPNSLEY